jgi:hypothetical protein
VLANGFRHLEHIQSGFSKDLFQLIIGHDLPPLIWVLFMLFDVGPHLLRDLWSGYGAGEPNISASCGEGFKGA